MGSRVWNRKETISIIKDCRHAVTMDNNILRARDALDIDLLENPLKAVFTRTFLNSMAWLASPNQG